MQRVYREIYFYKSFTHSHKKLLFLRKLYFKRYPLSHIVIIESHKITKWYCNKIIKYNLSAFKNVF